MRLSNILYGLYNLPPRESIRLIGRTLFSGRSGPNQENSWQERYSELAQQFSSTFSALTVDNLEGISPADFQREIESRIGKIDAESEGYSPDELDRQRDITIKFQWGHNHDFGAFKLLGRSGDRHISLLATFCSAFSLSPGDFRGKSVLDIGCWTGGTSLMLASLGAKVHAVEEVRKYAETAQFLANAFGFSNRITVEARSLYSFNAPEYAGKFDIVYFPGVIYHLSDPLIALRILYNACKPSGVILIETEGIRSEHEPLCLFEGSYVHRNGKKEDLSRGGWNWFIPSPPALLRMLQDAGFRDTRTTELCGSRFFAFARKTEPTAICRAGLSVPDIK